MLDICGCQYPLIKCGGRGCRCEQCGGFPRRLGEKPRVRVPMGRRPVTGISALDALRLAVQHIDHMTAWISEANRGPRTQRAYSFEALGEDIETIKEPLL